VERRTTRVPGAARPVHAGGWTELERGVWHGVRRDRQVAGAGGRGGERHVGNGGSADARHCVDRVRFAQAASSARAYQLLRG